MYQEWIGTLDGYPNAQIRAQVAGYLMKQDYQEGGTVKQGDLLFEIDPRPFQAALDQALAKEQQDEAMLGRTEVDVARFTPLAKTQSGQPGASGLRRAGQTWRPRPRWRRTRRRWKTPG